MKISKNPFAMLPLLVVLVGCEKAVASSFSAPWHNKELSHSSRRDLQQTCASGFTYNACVGCCGYKFTTKTALQDAVNGYPGNLGAYGVMNCWDVSSITDMSYLFSYNSLNEPIGCWNVASVTTMYDMFDGATDFNQPIGNWNVSSVTDMEYMFFYAPNFNQPIGNWNVGSVTDMELMFYGATNFNQPIGNWNVDSVIDMYGMFEYATNFNQPIGNWNVSSVTDMGYMFYNAPNFNQPIGNWNVGSVTNIGYMFYNATNFNQDLCLWYKKLPSTTTVTNIFDGTSCPNKAIPDFQAKASFCQACAPKPVLTPPVPGPVNQNLYRQHYFQSPVHQNLYRQL
jgi:surface protein